ncbi:MAG: hypothetical protein LQ347_002979 [Umbilicaria vellea]|nr:MAG: hypothetical protein LQ347_002979 [Umbilicaria vellea]
MRLQQNVPNAKLCSDYQGFINFPTAYGAILIRFVLYNNDSDVEVVQAIQKQIRITPVDRPGTSDPVAPWVSASLSDIRLSDDAASTWPGSFNDIAATQLLDLTARLCPYAPPENTSDTTRVNTYFAAAGINLSAGIYSPPSNVNFTASNLLINTSLNAQLDSPASHLNLSGSSWLAAAPALSGDFQSDYVSRAIVAWNAYLQLSASVAIYPEYYGLDGSAGTNILNVKKDSALLFIFSGKPPVDGFWSLTAYGIDYFLVPNNASGDIGVYSLGDRSSLIYPDGTLVYGDGNGNDGDVRHSSSHGTKTTCNADNKEFQILMQPADLTPPPEWTGNWLPAPSGGGEFTVTLRYYGPQGAITDGGYEEPRVQPTEAFTI